MFSESPTCLGDLELLTFAARVGALVIAAKQQNQAIAVCVAEHPQQDSLALRLAGRRLAERPQDFARVMTQPELEEPATELFAARTAADVNALLLEDLGHRDADCATLRWREFLAEPAQDGLVACGVRVELKLEKGHLGRNVRRASIGPYRVSARPDPVSRSGHEQVFAFPAGYDCWMLGTYAHRDVRERGSKW